MKKTLSLLTVLVFALTLFVGAAGAAVEWNTSTVDLKVVADVDSITPVSYTHLTLPTKA